MRNINTYYVDFDSLQSFIQQNSIENSPSLLIQVFTSKNDKLFIQTLLQDLTQLVPNAVIIGSTTDGEIMNGEVSTFKTVLSFTQFEHTKLDVAVSAHKEDGFFSGQQLAQTLIQKDTKLLIAFADGLHTNGEAFLQGIHSVDSNVMVAGGLAGDNSEFVQTYVFTKEHIITHGAVAVAFSSTELTVVNGYSFNWRCIGKELIITKVENNRVYTIDNKTAVDTYSHYLGEETAEGLPAIGIEFPLILTRNGIKIARAVLAKDNDGSLIFAGNLQVGDKVQFGYGDPMDILAGSNDIFNHLKENPSEAIFIYSCMARRHFMPDDIAQETRPLEYISPVSGFFTYGEFFTGEKKELLNQSMTVISLSEKNTVTMPKAVPIPPKKVSASSVNALINLVNVTGRESMEQEAVQQAQHIFEKLFEKSPDGILFMQNDVFIQCNQKMLDLFGYDTEDSFRTATPYKLFPMRQPDGSYSLIKLKEMRRLAKEKGSHQFEWMHQKENGETFWVDIMLTNMMLNDKETLYMVYRDITQRKQMEDQLHHQANYDALTGLSNRTHFIKKIEQKILDSGREQKKLALLFLDLDGFKRINDTLGHFIGDKVIQTVGARFQCVIRKEDIVSRFGGDEFAVMLTSVKNDEEISIAAERILSVLEKPMCIEGHTLSTSASIGISRYPIDHTNAYSLLQYADTAMYRAKEKNNNNFQFYTSKFTDDVTEQVLIEREFRESLKNKDFEVYYQPKINVKSKTIIGIEALVRWNHPRLGVVSADKFIPLAEKIGLIVELDLWMMRTAISEVSTWYHLGLNPGVLALNISMQQLEYTNLVKEISNILEEKNFKEEWLELEITESEIMLNPLNVLNILGILHRAGLSISIDDFGTGYSSLSHLKHLPIDTLKIDKSFVKDIPGDEEAEIIVKTIISLAENLNLNVIAEGVESEAQQDFLVLYGCYNIQGYYYSKPITGKEMKKFIMEWMG